MESWLLWINTLILVFLMSPKIIGGAFLVLVAAALVFLFVVGIIAAVSFETDQKLDNETREKIKKFLRDHPRFNIE